ncbi:MAG TPA: hypothetical protein VF392_15640 [Terracidiphilus sp.]
MRQERRRDLGDRNKNSPRERIGSLRVRDKFDAVEMPLNSTNQSQKARQALLLSAISTSGGIARRRFISLEQSTRLPDAETPAP